MKTKMVALLIVASFSVRLCFGQMTLVHEDIVKPSMDVKYREAMKKLKQACELHKLDFSWVTAAYNDNSYRHIANIKGLSDIEKNPFAPLESKLGKEAFAKLFAAFDECLETHSDYLSMQRADLSYLSAMEGDNFRSVTTWIPLPGKDQEAENILAEWKKLNENKKTQSGYWVFKIIFGRESGYSIISWGKNAVDEATKYQKAWELLGEDGTKLWLKTQAITKSISHKQATLMPEFGYSMPK
jgi:hypothetical protein